jgi:hypothetical protein
VGVQVPLVPSVGVSSGWNSAGCAWCFGAGAGVGVCEVDAGGPDGVSFFQWPPLRRWSVFGGRRHFGILLVLLGSSC